MHPGDHTYRNQVVRLADLTVTNDVIAGVTFENCTLVGPAVVVTLGGTLSGCEFEGSTEGIFWPTGDRSHVIGAIALVGCTVVRCRFQRVGIAYTPDQEAAFRRDFGF